MPSAREEKSNDLTALRIAHARPAMTDPSASLWTVNCGETGAAQRHRPNRLEPGQRGEEVRLLAPNSSFTRRASLADVPNAIFVRALLSATSRKPSGYTTAMMPHDTILDRELSRTRRASRLLREGRKGTRMAEAGPVEGGPQTPWRTRRGRAA